MYVHLICRTTTQAPVAAFVTRATVACIGFQPEGPNVFRKRTTGHCVAATFIMVVVPQKVRFRYKQGQPRSMWERKSP